MPKRIQQPQHRRLRLVDGTATPFWVELFHVGSPDLPSMVPRPTTEIELDGGRATDFMAPYIADESTPFAGLPFSIELAMMPLAYDLVHAFGNPYDNASWLIGGDTWTAIDVADLGTRKNSAGADIACIPPSDTVQTNRLINLIDYHEAHPSAVGGLDWIHEYRGAVVDNIVIGPNGPLMKFKIEGMIYGQIGKIAALPAGTESTPG